MNNIIKEKGKEADNRLRRMCDELSPQKRLVAVIATLIVFAVTAFYMAVSSVYRADKQALKVEHIQQLKITLPDTQTDSMNALKIKEDGHKQ